MEWVIAILVVVFLVIVFGINAGANQQLIAAQNKSEREQRMTQGHIRATEFESENAADWPVFHKDSGEWHKEYLLMSADQARLRRATVRVNPVFEVKLDTIIDVGDIVSVEIQRSATTVMQLDMQSVTKKKGGLTRALVGGLIAGPAGAIVGAGTAGSVTSGSTTGKQVTSYGPIDLVIGITDLHNPVVKMRMLSMPSAEDWLHRIRGAITLRSRLKAGE